MEPALKQRVVGAVVLVALAVIFLPMLVKGPAPESGISDVPLQLPKAPEGEFAGEGVKTQELPLVAPGGAPASGVVGMDASGDAAQGVEAGGMLPAATAGGDFAVSFGRYASPADAQKVVAALTASQLPGYQEAVTDKDRTLYRVRIGPFGTQADAEAARLRATHVRDDVGAKVVVLSADETGPTAPAAASAPSTAATAPSATPSSATAAATPAPAKAEALPPVKPAAEPAAKPATAVAAPTPATTKPVATAASTPAKPATPPPAPAAANTGFAVQLGAFGNADEANRLRDRARAAGLRAFVESVRTDKGVLSRVRVGPVLTRAEADQLKAQVVAKLGIADAIVKPHP